MKAVQITLDEDLLREFDADAEVRRNGRSAVFRAVAREYLRRRRRREIREQFARAYARDGDLDPEWEGWEEQGEWPPWDEADGEKGREET